MILLPKMQALGILVMKIYQNTMKQLNLTYNHPMLVAQKGLAQGRY
jgi:hypothetical protein